MFGGFKKSPETETEKEQTRITRSNVVLHPDKNPCVKEQEMAYKCLGDHDYDRDKCSKHFQNYRNCKDFWASVTRERRRQRLKPYMPPESEREIYIKRYKEALQKE